MRRVQRLAAAASCCCLALAVACTAHPGPARPRTVSLLASGDVPVSSDPPIPAARPIHAPSEPREPPKGPLVYLVDSGSESVYEYDTTRGRFLGPAPRVDLVQSIVTLPGYPTVVSKSPPQGATLADRHLFVAGGLDGTVVDIPLDSKGELGNPHAFDLPAHSISFDRTERSNGETPTGKPFINLVASTATRVLAITHDQITLTSEAYLLDPKNGHVLRVRQLPGGLAAAAASDESGFVICMSDGTLLHVDGNLTTLRATALHGTGASVTVAGQSAYVGLSNPAKLMKVDLRTGKVRQLATAPTSYAGPVVAFGTAVWWALPDLSTIREIDATTGMQHEDVYPCRFISAMIVYQNAILATCVQHNQLARVSLADGSVTLVNAGGFPVSLVG